LNLVFITITSTTWAGECYMQRKLKQREQESETIGQRKLETQVQA